MNLAEISKENLQEMALIEIANLLLIEKKEAIDFKVLMDEMQKLLGLTNEQASQKMGQFYTDLNIDGRFISIGDNRWGLKGWYPVEQVEEETVPASKTKKKKGKKAAEEDLDDFDDLSEDEDLEYDELEDFDDEEDLDEEDLDDEEDEDFDEDEDDDLIEDEDEEMVEDEYDLDDEDEEEEEEADDEFELEEDEEDEKL